MGGRVRGWVVGGGILELAYQSTSYNHYKTIVTNEIQSLTWALKKPLITGCMFRPCLCILKVQDGAQTQGSVGRYHFQRGDRLHTQRAMFL